MQTDEIGPGRKYANFFDCARKMYATEGIGSFFRGIGPTLARAAPVNAMVHDLSRPSTNVRHS